MNTDRGAYLLGANSHTSKAKQDPLEAGTVKAYRRAWDKAIAEYNSFGLAQSVPKLKIDDATSGLMFGFKADLERDKGSHGRASTSGIPKPKHHGCLVCGLS